MIRLGSQEGKCSEPVPLRRTPASARETEAGCDEEPGERNAQTRWAPARPRRDESSGNSEPGARAAGLLCVPSRDGERAGPVSR